MSGKGSEIGANFEELKKILDGVLEEFDAVIGLDTFEIIINHPKLKHLPFYLETPNELDGYAKEISLLRGLRK